MPDADERIVYMNVGVPVALRERVWRLASRRSQYLGRKVGVEDVVRDAIKDYLRGEGA